MALDFCRIDLNGTPHDDISLSDETHSAMMNVAIKAGLRQLLRMKDFYDDVDYSTADLEELKSDLVRVGESLKQEDRNTCNAMRVLVNKAQSLQETVGTISD
jgi:hypothetical protein